MKVTNFFERKSEDHSEEEEIDFSSQKYFGIDMSTLEPERIILDLCNNEFYVVKWMNLDYEKSTYLHANIVITFFPEILERFRHL